MALSLEMTWRVFHPFGAKISFSTPDPETAWRFRPGQKYWFFKENDHSVEGRINSFGWKDREWSLLKPPGTCRVAVLGDSFVESLQLEADKNFLSLTQQNLAGRLPCQIEVMNFGRSEATQTEELLFLNKDVLRFNPDIIVLLFYPPNDIRDVTAETAWFARPFYKVSENGSLLLDTSYKETRQFKLRKLIDPIKRQSAFISWLIERLNSLKVETSKQITNTGGSAGKLHGYLSLATSQPDPIYVNAYKLNKRLIKEMADISKSKGIKFILMSTDIPAYIPEVEQTYKKISPDFTPEFFDNDLKEFSRGIGIEFIGLEEPFSQAYKADQKPLHWGFALENKIPRLGYEEHGGHWNYAGHQKTAVLLSGKLQEILSGKEKSRAE